MILKNILGTKSKYLLIFLNFAFGSLNHLEHEQTRQRLSEAPKVNIKYL